MLFGLVLAMAFITPPKANAAVAVEVGRLRGLGMDMLSQDRDLLYMWHQHPTCRGQQVTFIVRMFIRLMFIRDGL